MSRRFFRHGELPLVLLALLQERPMHGYELMAELDRLFGPIYRPSPGSIYPAIEALAAEGLIAATDHPGRRDWELTNVGRDALENRKQILAAIEVRTGARLRPAPSLETALQRLASRARSAAERVDLDRLEELLEKAGLEIQKLYEGMAVVDEERSKA